MSDETKRQQEFTDAPLYEIEGAIRGKADDAIAAFIAHARESQREQTAATILAALLVRNELTTGDSVNLAVTLTDALRAELAKVKP
jgi:hypothetical protein